MSKAEIIISAQDKTKQAFDALNRNINTSATAIGAVLGGATVAVGAGLLKAAKDAADYADEMGKTAQKVGITTESLSGLRYAADLSGVSFEGLQNGLRKVSQNAFEASNGMKTYQEDFAALGISVEDANGKLKSSDQILGEVADQFAQMENGTRKTALAVSLFGKSGADLIPLLNGGSAAIKSMTDEAEQFGLIVNQQTVKAAEQFNDNLTRFNTAAEGFKISVGNALLPALADVTDAFIAGYKESQSFIDGLARIADLGINGNAERQRFERITELNAQIVRDVKSLEGLTYLGAPGEFNRLTQNIENAKAEIKSLRDEASKPSRPAVADAPTLTPQRASTGKSPAQTQAENAAKAAQEFTNKLIEQAAQLGLTGEALVRYEAANLKLSSSQQAAIDQSLGKIRAYELEQKAVQDLADMQALLQGSDDRQLADLEAASAEEQARIEASRQAYETFYADLVRQNEDLNVQLIADDRQRAEAQLALEYERRVERIRLLMLEGEEAQTLIDKETEAYELKLKQIQESTKETTNLSRDLGRVFTSQFEQAILGAGDFGDALDGLGRDLERLALQSITNPIFSAFEQGAAQLIGSFDFGSIFGGGRAAGGPVSRGKFYEVNEQMPEIFSMNGKDYLMMGGANGRVNQQSGGSAAGSNVQVNIINNASGVETQSTEREEGGLRIVDVVIERVSSKIAGDIRRGRGDVPNAIQSAYGVNRVAGAF